MTIAAFRTWVVLLAVGCGFATTSFAQDPKPTQDDAKKKEPKPQTVEVIGERYTDLQKQPLSGVELDAAELDRRRISNVQDLTTAVPNVFSTNSGTQSFGDTYAIRGLTNGTFFGNPSMSLYVDDIPFGDPHTYYETLTMTENVEILRGPQPGLFGRYPYGGVMNVTSRRPTDTLEGGAYVEGGSYGLLNYGAYMMGALIPGKLRIRLGVSEESGSGFISNANLGTMEDPTFHVNGNVAIYYTPTPEWDISAVAGVQKSKDGGPRINSLFAPNPYVVDSDVPGAQDRRTNMQAVRIGYKIGGVQLLSVTTRRDWRLNETSDLDFSPLPDPVNTFQVINGEQEIWSQEFRVKSDSANSPLAWMVGLYGHLKHSTENDLHHFTVAGPGTVDDDTVFDLRQRWGAIFGDASYKANELRFHASARWDYVAEDMVRSDTLGAPPSTSGGANFPHPSFKIGIDYQVCEHALVYVDGGHAYKPGGFNAYFNGPSAFATFANETNWFAELGVKSDLVDNKVRANLSAFYYGIHNYQVERSSAIGYTTFNATTATSYGVEAEVRAEPVSWLSAYASGGLTRTTLDSFFDFTTATNLSGAFAPYVPSFNFAVGAKAMAPFGAFGYVDFIMNGRTQFTDGHPTAIPFNYFQNPYGILNFGAGYKSDHFQARLFMTNALNRFYYTYMNPDFVLGAVSIPRMWGGELAVTF